MKTAMKRNLAMLGLMLALAGCKIDGPDFFVPLATFTGPVREVIFEPAGGTESFSIEANCDWSVSCSAEWASLSATSGKKNGNVTVIVMPTKLPRNTSLIVYSNEIESRTSIISIIQKGIVEISAVSATTVTDTASAQGTSATLYATYSSLSVSETDSVTAGFLLKPRSGGENIELCAPVDRTAEAFCIQATGLIRNETYTCTAWARLNNEPEVTGEPVTFTPILLPAELQSVSAAIVSDTKTASGSTATFESSYTAVSLSSRDRITAGFTLIPDGGTSFEIDAVVDTGNRNFKAEATGLVPGTNYTCTAWARLNEGDRIEGAPIRFKPTAVEPVTVTADFSNNILWRLPENSSSLEQKEVVVTDKDGYTWKISGGCINSGCLWLACQSKSKFNGYVVLPQLKDKTVYSIVFPNDGPSASGKARITLSFSEDGGNSFNPVPGYEQVECGTFRLTGQKPGCVYKIENVADNGNSGFSKTTGLIILAE